MASPQAENGHTQINNETMEKLYSFPFTLRELKVVLFLLRKTWGWKKKGDLISASQIAEGTKIARRHVQETIKILVTKSVLVVTKSVRGNVVVNHIGFNKNHDTWSNPKSVLVTKSVHPPTTESVVHTGDQIGAHKRKVKESINKTVLRTVAPTQLSLDISEVIEFFEANVCPIMSLRDKNRYAASNLIKVHGKEKVKALIRAAAAASGDQYAPSVASMIDLQRKAASLYVWAKKQKTQGIVKIR